MVKTVQRKVNKKVDFILAKPVEEITPDEFAILSQEHQLLVSLELNEENRKWMKELLSTL